MGVSKHQKMKRVSQIFQENQPQQCVVQAFNNNIKTNLQKLETKGESFKERKLT